MLGMAIYLESSAEAGIIDQDYNTLDPHKRYTSQKGFKRSLGRPSNGMKTQKPKWRAAHYKEVLEKGTTKEKLNLALECEKKARKTSREWYSVRSLGRAVELLKQVVEAKDIEDEDLLTARYTLAEIYTSSVWFDSMDAKPLYKKAKKQKHADSISKLGDMHRPFKGYYYGFKDCSHKKVAEYYEEASELGHKRASYELAMMYYKKHTFVKKLDGSIDDNKTREKALYYYKIAACSNKRSPDEDDRDVQNVEMLAQYEYGQILLKDKDSAKRQEGKRLIRESAKKGHIPAIEHQNREQFKQALVLKNSPDVKEMLEGWRRIDWLAKKGYKPAMQY